MPHALLLQGRQGVGKQDFALHFAQSLLCEHPSQDGHVCQTCQSCNWFEQGNHPDYRLIGPEEVDEGGQEESSTPSKSTRKTQISVDQIRDLSNFLGLSSHRSGVRIVLIYPAEALNVASANALLKMLEEPPHGVLFILVSHQPQRLLPTIRSRCQVIDMPVPDRKMAESWLAAQGVDQVSQRLAYAGWSPLPALQDTSTDRQVQDVLKALAAGSRLDPFAVAAMCVKFGMLDAVTLLQKWIYDLCGMRIIGQPRYHIHQAETLQALSKRVDLPKLLEFQRTLDDARRRALHPLNAELQLESLMIQYVQIFAAQT